MDNTPTETEIEKDTAKSWQPRGGTAAACMIAASVASGQFSDAYQSAVQVADERNGAVSERFAPIGNIDSKVAGIMKPTNTIAAIKKGATEVIYEKGIKNGPWNIKILSTVGAPATLAASVIGVNLETATFADRIKEQRARMERMEIHK